VVKLGCHRLEIPTSIRLALLHSHRSFSQIDSRNLRGIRQAASERREPRRQGVHQELHFPLVVQHAIIGLIVRDDDTERESDLLRHRGEFPLAVHRHARRTSTLVQNRLPAVPQTVLSILLPCNRIAYKDLGDASNRDNLTAFCSVYSLGRIPHCTSSTHPLRPCSREQ